MEVSDPGCDTPFVDSGTFDRFYRNASDISAQIGQTLQGLGFETLGKKLGEGSFGTVHVIHGAKGDRALKLLRSRDIEPYVPGKGEGNSLGLPKYQKLHRTETLLLQDPQTKKLLAASKKESIPFDREWVITPECHNEQNQQRRPPHQ